MCLRQNSTQGLDKKLSPRPSPPPPHASVGGPTTLHRGHNQGGDAQNLAPQWSCHRFDPRWTYRRLFPFGARVVHTANASSARPLEEARFDRLGHRQGRKLGQRGGEGLREKREGGGTRLELGAKDPSSPVSPHDDVSVDDSARRWGMEL